MNEILRNVELVIVMVFLTFATVSVPHYLQAHSKLERRHFEKEEKKEVQVQIRDPIIHSTNYMLVGEYVYNEYLERDIYRRWRDNIYGQNEGENQRDIFYTNRR